MAHGGKYGQRDDVSDDDVLVVILVVVIDYLWSRGRFSLRDSGRRAAVTAATMSALISSFKDYSKFAKRLPDFVLASDRALTEDGRWLVFLGVGLVVGLYALRKKRRWIYGAIEVVLGIGALVVFRQLPTGDIVTWAVSYAGPIYLAIRGLDNFDRGLPEPWRKYFWWLGDKPSG